MTNQIICTKYTKGTNEWLDNEAFNLHQFTNEIIETCHGESL